MKQNCMLLRSKEKLRIEINEDIMKRLFTILLIIFTAGFLSAQSSYQNRLDEQTRIDIKLNSGLSDKISERGFKLYQNYPNPFNPETIIEYYVPKGSFVSLKVYNLLGNEVATIVNGYQDSGNHLIRFNAYDLNSGSKGLSSGIYFYVLESGDFKQTRKMILLG